MKDSYRKMDVELVPKKKTSTVTIYVLPEFIYSDKNHCPFCFYPLPDLKGSGRVCSPAKRLCISGWIFRRRYCSLTGWHEHYKCSRCKAHWIAPTAEEPLTAVGHYGVSLRMPKLRTPP